MRKLNTLWKYRNNTIQKVFNGNQGVFHLNVCAYSFVTFRLQFVKHVNRCPSEPLMILFSVERFSVIMTGIPGIRGRHPSDSLDSVVCK